MIWCGVGPVVWSGAFINRIMPRIREQQIAPHTSRVRGPSPTTPRGEGPRSSRGLSSACTPWPVRCRRWRSWPPPLVVRWSIPLNAPPTRHHRARDGKNFERVFADRAFHEEDEALGGPARLLCDVAMPGAEGRHVKRESWRGSRIMTVPDSHGSFAQSRNLRSGQFSTPNDIHARRPPDALIALYVDSISTIAATMRSGSRSPRRVTLESWSEALRHREGDIKTIIEFSQI
jgi:hypothetical protein